MPYTSPTTTPISNCCMLLYHLPSPPPPLASLYDTAADAVSVADSTLYCRLCREQLQRWGEGWPTMLPPLTTDLKSSTGAISVITAQIPNLTCWGTSELTPGKSVTGAQFALIVLANAQTCDDIYGFMPWGFPMMPCSAASVTILLPLLSALPCIFWTAILQTPTSRRRNQLKTHLPLTKLKDQQLHLTSTWHLYSPKFWAFILFLSLIIHQELSQVASVFVWQTLLIF